MKRILFVCVENSCRSQMAEGFARALGGGEVEAFSAGSKPSGIVDPRAMAFMKERGLDISGQKSKGFEELPDVEFDYSVTMGCRDVCPLVSSDRQIAWDIRDPKGLSDPEFRKVRYEIGNKVAELLSTIRRDL